MMAIRSASFRSAYQILRGRTQNIACYHNTKTQYIINDGNLVSVSEFFKKRTVLVTGGTGCLGQNLVEKLLRGCPEIDKVVLAVRDDNKKSAEEKFRNFLFLEVFRRHKKECPNFAEKIRFLRVQLEEPDLGLTEAVYSDLCRDVSVVCHLAASVVIHAPLRDNLTNNAVTTASVCAFAKKCRDLKAFVYVSSAYSHVSAKYIKEEVTEPPIPTEIIKRIIREKNFSVNLDDKIATTYTFSKQIAEKIVAEELDQLPAAVFRPALVTPSLAEPYPGWYSGVVGFNGIFKAIQSGKLRYLLGKPDIPIELVPVDLCANAIIGISWLLGTRSGLKTPEVFNFHSSSVNELTMQDFAFRVNRMFEETGSTRRLTVVPSELRFSLLMFLRYIVSCLMEDLTSLPHGRQNSRVKQFILQLRAINSIDKALLYYSGREFQNINRLYHVMSAEDREKFPMDLKQISWNSYIPICMGQTNEEILKHKNEL